MHLHVRVQITDSLGDGYEVTTCAQGEADPDQALIDDVYDAVDVWEVKGNEVQGRVLRRIPADMLEAIAEAARKI